MGFRRIRAISASLAIAFGLIPWGLPGVFAQDKAAPSAQSGSVASAAQGTTTVWVPQDQVVYETVYDLECVQVPTTQFETRYNTECQTQTVPVTRTICEQVPTTQIQTHYKTEYKTETVPVTRTICEQVPTTQIQTRYKTEYKTQTVPVTRTTFEQVPTTQIQTQYKTEYKTQTVPVTRTIFEQVPTTQIQTQYNTEYKTRTVPITRVVVEQVPTTVMQTQYKTEYKTQTVPITSTVADVVNVPRTYTVYVPTTADRQPADLQDHPRADHADCRSSSDTSRSRRPFHRPNISPERPR